MYKKVLSTASHNLLSLLCVLCRDTVPGLRFTPMQVVYTWGPVVLNIIYVSRVYTGCGGELRGLRNDNWFSRGSECGGLGRCHWVI